jgi:methyl-accepting chemotaxis protein-1 (serine sensor receptor)
MRLTDLPIRTKLGLSFATLTLMVVGVSALGYRAMTNEHQEFTRYVNEGAVRLAHANDVLDAANARAIAARNLVLVTNDADREVEKVAVTGAHQKVTADVARLKRELDTMQGVSADEKRLFAALESVESRYGPWRSPSSTWPWRAGRTRPSRK